MKHAGSVCRNLFLSHIFFPAYQTVQATKLVITLIVPLPHPFLHFLSSRYVLVQPLLSSLTVQGTIFSLLDKQTSPNWSLRAH